MTLERLENYYIIANQIKAFEMEYLPSYISAVDTTKPAIQNCNISDITCDTALEQLDINPAIKAEYARLRAELSELNAFIFSVDDELIRAILINRCCLNRTYEDIGRMVHYSAEHCSKLLKKYIGNIG
uniref:hypothetical protein n=1 Tax=Eubacterium sp. TaxID=142586 RepID=UPI0040282E46